MVNPLQQHLLGVRLVRDLPAVRQQSAEGGGGVRDGEGFGQHFAGAELPGRGSRMTSSSAAPLISGMYQSMKTIS
jgi:hypothetical protein